MNTEKTSGNSDKMQQNQLIKYECFFAQNISDRIDSNWPEESSPKLSDISLKPRKSCFRHADKHIE